MQLIEVSIPRNARAMGRRHATLALQIGSNGKKVPARLRANNPGDLRGRRIICAAEIEPDRNQAGVQIHVVALRPTNKRAPTHGTPYRSENGMIIIPEL